MKRLALLLIIIVGSTTFAGDVYWVGDVNDSWMEPLNWHIDTLPGTGDNALVYPSIPPILTTTCHLYENGSAAITSLQVAWKSVENTVADLTIDGSLTVTGTAYIGGIWPTRTGHLTVNASGTLNVGGHMIVGQGGGGTVTLNGGTIKTYTLYSPWPSGSSHVEIISGDFIVDTWADWTVNGTMNIQNGAFYLTNTANLAGDLAAGYITGFGSSANVIVTPNVVLNGVTYTRLTAVGGWTPDCGDWGFHAMDFNKDCYVNFEDFALFAAEWLKCTDPTVEGCTDEN
jgi:hypothetical protein